MCEAICVSLTGADKGTVLLLCFTHVQSTTTFVFSQVCRILTSCCCCCSPGVDIYGACGGASRCATLSDSQYTWASGTRLGTRCVSPVVALPSRSRTVLLCAWT